MVRCVEEDVVAPGNYEHMMCTINCNYCVIAIPTSGPPCAAHDHATGARGES